MGKTPGSEANQIQESCTDDIVIRAGTLIRDVEAIFLPTAIEERNDAVIENVEELAGDAVFRLNTFEEKFSVRMRQHASCGAESHKVDEKFRLAVFSCL